MSISSAFPAHRLLTLLLPALLCASARGVDPLRAVKMKKWGVPPANYSGITPLGGDRYAVVSDAEPSDGYYEFRISLHPRTGRVLSAVRGRFLSNPRPVLTRWGESVRDAEGIAFHPGRGTVFISGEGDQQILEYDSLGHPTGFGLSIPAHCATGSIVPNRGFEALCYAAPRRRFYTMTESPLRADGPVASAQSPRAPQCLRLLSFGDDGTFCGEHIYRMEQPRTRTHKHFYTYGISALAALPDGRLLVLEREINIPRKALGGSVRHSIFLVNPPMEAAHPAGTPLALIPESCYLSKTPVYRFTTRLDALHGKLGNYEAMCLGPRLEDGRLTLLLLNDSQAGAGNRLYRLKDFIKVLILDEAELHTPLR